MRRAARSPAASGTGWLASTTSIRSQASGMAVAGQHQPFERAGPRRLEGASHRRRGLAGADDDGAPGDRRRQPAAQRRLGLGGGERRPEQIPQHGALRLVRFSSSSLFRLAKPAAISYRAARKGQRRIRARWRCGRLSASARVVRETAREGFWPPRRDAGGCAGDAAWSRGAGTGAEPPETSRSPRCSRSWRRGWSGSSSTYRRPRRSRCRRQDRCGSRRSPPRDRRSTSSSATSSASRARRAGRTRRRRGSPRSAPASSSIPSG